MNDLNKILQAKYPHLELSILSLSQVQKDSESKRIDSEYFKKEYLVIDSVLDNLNPIYLDIKNIVSGPFGSTLTSESYITEGIDFIRVTDIKGGFFIDKKNVIKISEADNQKIKNSELMCGDFVISKVGNSIGYVAQLQDDIKQCNISENNIGIKMRGFDECYKKYVLTFLNSKYGQLQIWRRISGNVQPKINVSDFSKIKIPQFSSDFQRKIEKLVKDSHKALENSKLLYKEVENLLYEALGLDSSNPLESLARHSLLNKESQKYPHLNISIRPLSQSYGISGRLDSEYYQTKYDAIERKIKGYQGGYFRLQPSEIKDSNFTPKAQAKYRYIELANIGNNGNISEPLEDLGENLPTRARRKVKTGDFIMSSIEGSLASCAIITPEFDNCLVSTGFYVLDSVELNSEILLVLFKCAFFQEYLRKFPSGTILTAISKDELKNILIPKIDTATQEQIACKIQKSFSLRKKAKDLLESAKFRVENAIENEGKNA